jgi:O-antigen ligase
MSVLAACGWIRAGGLYLFALALPFNLWATQAGLALAALGVVARSAIRREWPALPAPLLAPIGLFVAAVVLSQLGSGAGAPRLSDVLGFWPLLAPLVLVAAIPDERTLSNMLWMAAGMAFLMGLYGVLQHFTGADYFRIQAEIVRPAPGTPGRFLAIGNFEAHTTYAFSLAFPLLTALGLVAERVARWPSRVALLAAALAATAGILFSYVRSIWIGLLVGVTALALLRRGAAMRVALAVAAAGLVVVLAVPSLRARALSIVDPHYNAGRTYIWDRSWHMLSDHPVTGIGFGNYRRLQDAYFDPAAPAAQVPRTGAHCTYLHVAVEMGVLGLTAFLWLWIRFFPWALRTYRRLGRERRFARGFIAGSIGGVACFLVGSFFQESFYDGEVAFMLWFAVSGAFVVGREGRLGAGARAAGAGLTSGPPSP